MFNDDEKRLRFYLTYGDNGNNNDAVNIIKNEFLNYWLEMDKKHNSDYTGTIGKLYLSDENKRFAEVADEIGYTVRTLKRYREKFVVKINELIDTIDNKVEPDS